MPITGRYAVYGTDWLNAVAFGVEEINNAGGIKGLGGAKIEMVVADDQADAKIAMTEYERLINKEKVDFIMGPCPSPNIAVIAPLADRYQMPTMSFGGLGDAVYKLNLKWNVHLGPEDRALGGYLMQYVLDMVEEFNLPRDRIVFFAGDSDVLKGPIEASRDVAKARGYGDKIVGEVYAPVDAKDLASYALKLKALKPDIYVANDSSTFASLMIRAMDAIEWYPPVWGDTTAVFDVTNKKAVGEELWNKVVRRPGVIKYEWTHPDYQPKSVADFVARITPWLTAKGQVYNTRHTYTQGVYALVKVLNEIGTRDKAAINDGLHKLSIPETDPWFVQGQFAPVLAWEANGRPVNCRTLGLQHQVKDGAEKIVLIYPKSVRPAGVTPWVK